MPAEPMDEWELSMHRLHLQDARTRIERGETVDPLVLIKIAKRALQEVERVQRLMAEHAQVVRAEFAQVLTSEYDRWYQETAREHGVERQTPRTMFHVVIEKLLEAKP